MEELNKQESQGKEKDRTSGKVQLVETTFYWKAVSKSKALYHEFSLWSDRLCICYIRNYLFIGIFKKHNRQSTLLDYHPALQFNQR